MVTLRAASLVRVETAGDKASLYTLREDTVDGMGELLRSYLGTSRKGE
jgi:hypothetical protein